MNQAPSQNAITGAFVIAIIADLLQIPFTALDFTGVLTLPSQMLDFGFDAVVMVVLCCLLGFRIALIPALLAELVPFVDILPAWTCVVAFIVWQQKNQQSPIPPIPTRPVIDVQEAEIVSQTRRGASPPPLLNLAPAIAVSSAPSNGDRSIADKLTDLADLHRRSLITDEEYEEKRREILRGF